MKALVLSIRLTASEAYVSQGIETLSLEDRVQRSESILLVQKDAPYEVEERIMIGADSTSVESEDGLIIFPDRNQEKNQEDVSSARPSPVRISPVKSSTILSSPDKALPGDPPSIAGDPTPENA